MKDFFLEQGFKILKLAKPKIEDYINKTDFLNLLLKNLTPETKKALSQKLFEITLENLKSLDDKEVAKLAIDAKNSVVEYLDKNDENIKETINNILNKSIKLIEEDKEFQKQINDLIKNIIKEQIDEFIK
ncbi:hypothetical protein [Hydrogenothermus marinus]|uniref:Uncharacterized protein n=1 Tax=Hydrogenothermus marinus TaxID=133270 RepID=A0A3M0BES3_9AQUI|nr:hypothetical protein [Hydrogenothermus marinus]RMA93085.1 hypothetical protein CLV39_1568 [Hydrogenothermus marinus]